jgi:spoIIIJ-associated protein
VTSQTDSDFETEGGEQAAADPVEVGAGKAGPSLTDLLVREGDVAGDYLEQLLDIVDFDGDIDMDVEGDRAAVAIVGDNLSPLIGPRGATLDALQELTRLAVLQKTGARSRLMLDVGGYRAHRRLELVAVAKNAAERVKAHGDPVALEAMNPFERKVVHDAIADIAGVSSESEGEEPDRHVVVLPDP